MTTVKQNLVIAGLNVDVFSDAAASEIGVSSTEVVAFFLLHGRLSSSKKVERIAESLIQLTREAPGAQKHQRDLIVITFDHRNHGTRKLAPQANNDWSKDPEQNNERHAIDMYSIQTGTARDVSFLIDFLPAYLYPSNERRISSWGVAGISLGGHSTWISLSSEPRISYGIPIIGCPDFLQLMTPRAQKYSITLNPPYLPETLLSYIRHHDPVSTPFQAHDASNPFMGKKVLVLSGGIDTLVPWAASKQFVENLWVGNGGVKRVLVVPDAGHECTAAMVAEAAQFIEMEALQIVCQRKLREMILPRVPS